MQPIRIETWTDPAGVAPPELVADVLTLPFDTNCDEVLRGKIWKNVLDAFPAWPQLCRASAAAAREFVSDSEELRSAVRDAIRSPEHDIARRVAILKARSLRLPTDQEREAAREDLELERARGEALLAGIRAPSVRMVASGACVLWPEGHF